MPTALHIKNMVCQRCVRVVKDELEQAGYKVQHIDLGEAVLAEDNIDKVKVSQLLLDNGFELLEEKSARLVNDIKTFIITHIRNGGFEDNNQKVSALLEAHFNKEYNYLSQMFSHAESTTLEKYIIAQKVEQVKEWLVYDELTLSEMAYKLGYSSVAHLSSQFKQVTGFSPTQFKSLKHRTRKGLDEV